MCGFCYKNQIKGEQAVRKGVIAIRLNNGRLRVKPTAVPSIFHPQKDDEIKIEYSIIPAWFQRESSCYLILMAFKSELECCVDTR